MTDVPSPETVAQVRHRYRRGDPVDAICADTGLTRRMLSRCVDGAYPDGASEQPAPIPRRIVRRRTAGRAALVGRLWRAAEQQIDEIELRMRAAGFESGEHEGNARTFATLVKTLRELSAFDEAQRACKPKRQTMDDDDDPIPRDIDEFRRELARRIESFVASRSGPGVSGNSES